jgi:hypothetical protein
LNLSRFFQRLSGCDHKSFLGLPWKYFAKRPVDATNTSLDGPHLRVLFVRHEHERLKGVPNVVIHEVDYVKALSETPQSVALIQIKD